MKTKRQKRKHQMIWIAISILATVGMVLFLITPLIY